MISTSSSPSTVSDISKTMLGPKVMPKGSAPSYAIPDSKTCSETDRDRYLPLLRPYKVWHSHYMSAMGTVHVYKRPGEEPIAMSIDEYNKSDRTPFSCIRISKKPVDETDYTSGYLSRLGDDDFKNEEKKEYDATDVKFITGKDTADSEGSLLKKLVFYGLHTYGGYYGFFRPDLQEVIYLLAKTILPSTLPSLEAIYVTTEMHPSDHIGDCYDQHEDRHRAMTTVYVIAKSTSPSPSLPFSSLTTDSETLVTSSTSTSDT